MKVLVAYDGSLKSKEALRYGIKRAKEAGGQLVALHVFPSLALAGYDSVPYARGMARAEADRQIEEARGIIGQEGRGIWAKVVTEEGIPEDETVGFAREWGADVVLCPPAMRSVIKSLKRLFKREGAAAREGEVIDQSAEPLVAVVYSGAV